MWTFRKHSRGKVKPQLERLDQRAVPATGFGPLGFAGPVVDATTFLPGAFGFRANNGLSAAAVGLNTNSVLDGRLALQRNTFRAPAFFNRPFFSAFNNVGVTPTGPLGPGGFFNIVDTPSGPAGLQRFLGLGSTGFRATTIAGNRAINPLGLGGSPGIISGFRGAALTPTTVGPFAPGGFFNIVDTPSGPAGLQ